MNSFDNRDNPSNADWADYEMFLMQEAAADLADHCDKVNRLFDDAAFRTAPLLATI
jgi:hypothetical protein